MSDLLHNIAISATSPYLFYRDKEEFMSFHKRLKITACPFCKMRGCLILNGRIYAYTEDSNTDTEKRGHRVLCNNRKLRQGCGRTFSVIISKLIRHLMINATTIWMFLLYIKEGLPIIGSFRKTGTSMSETTAYRMFNKFKNAQPRIRTLLTGIKDPPSLKHCNDPVIQTIGHLQSVFPQSPCPVSEFQRCFQTTFF